MYSGTRASSLLIYIFLIPASFCFSEACKAAGVDTSYLDAKRRVTGEKKARFIRLSEKVGDLSEVREYYINGGMSMRGVFLSLEPEIKYGAFVYYDDQGKKTEEGTYSNNEKDGKWTTYFPGTEHRQTVKNYVAGVLDGPATYYDPKTYNRLSDRSYKAGKLHGVMISYQPQTKQLKSKISYEHGVEHGPVSYYDTVSGYKRVDGEMEAGKPRGKWQYYYDTSDRIFSVRDFDKEPDSISVLIYHKSGNLKGEIVAGSEGFGRSRYYFDMPGKIRAEVETFWSKADGNAVYFDSSTGNVRRKGKYIRGRPTERWEWYYPESGKLEGYENYMQGKLNGDNEEYYESGKLRERATYYFGVPVKEHTVYDESGGIMLKEHFPGSDGYCMSAIYDSASQKVLAKAELRNNIPVGKFYSFYPGTEVVAYSANFKDGQAEGAMTFYYDDGKKAQELHIKGGRLNGRRAFYYKGSGGKWLDMKYDEQGNTRESTIYFEDGRVKRKHNTEGGTLAEKCFDEFGRATECRPLLEVATFDGNVFTYIGNELKYPEQSKTQEIEGKVVVDFVVSEDGDISNVSIRNSLDKDCDREAIRLISQMPKWKPAKVDGVPVKSTQSLPIVFWIPDEEKLANRVRTN